MQHNLNLSELSGLCTITKKAGVSLLSTGEVSMYRPFEELMSKDFDLRMGIKVSEKAYDKAARKQSNNNVIVNHSTLLKRINPFVFLGNCSQHTIAEVTGKKVEWKSGKPKYPALTVEEEMWCNIADWAYSSFGTLRNVSVTVNLNSGIQLQKSF